MCVISERKCSLHWRRRNAQFFEQSCHSPSHSRCSRHGFKQKKKMIESSSRLFKVTGPWSDCVAGNFNYTSNYASIADEVYPQIFAMAPNLDIMIYSGDAGLCCCVFGLLFFPCFVDACVPFFGTVQWTSQIGGTVTDAWRPWQSSGQLAGGC